MPRGRFKPPPEAAAGGGRAAERAGAAEQRVVPAGPQVRSRAAAAALLPAAASAGELPRDDSGARSRAGAPRQASAGAGPLRARPGPSWRAPRRAARPPSRCPLPVRHGHAALAGGASCAFAARGCPGPGPGPGLRAARQRGRRPGLARLNKGRSVWAPASLFCLA